MKIYVGIDIAKLNHFAAAISSDGEIIIESFKFTNDADGFQLLISKLDLSFLHFPSLILSNCFFNFSSLISTSYPDR